MNNKIWTVTLEEDPETGDLILPLNEEILSECNLKEGDTVEWIDNKNGTWSMKKKDKKVWVLVEAVSTFRMRYMVEVPEDHPEYALDTVTMSEAKEFSQEHLGEQIVSHRIVSMDEAIRICDVDNDYCSKWNNEQKVKAFFTKDGEKVEQ